MVRFFFKKSEVKISLFDFGCLLGASNRELIENPDEEDQENQEFMGNSTSSFFPSGQTSATSFSGSRRVAPVMGNRGLESQRLQQERSRSKSKTKTGSPRTNRKQQPVQVGALDERNLKRAVHRYGTLPKGARIGAYLESLRVSGMTPEPVPEQGLDSDDSSIHGNSLGRGTKPPSAPQPMLRSNSSHGGFGRASPSPRTNPTQHRRLESPLVVGEIQRGVGPPELEFPPPPVDLPPPPTDFQGKPTSPEPKSPLSPQLSESRTLGSPAVGSLSSPGSTLDMVRVSSPPEATDSIRPFNKANMEAQLVSEISVDKKQSPNPPNPLLNSPSAGSGPAAQLVTELFESFKSKPKPEPEPKSHEIDFKANLRKVKEPTKIGKESPPKQIDFKAQLKKTDSSYSKPEVEQRKNSADDSDKSPVDFKSRLRKVSGSVPTTEAKNEEVAVVPEQDDKRKSTGSISSLRKMWESGESPKLGGRKQDESGAGQTVKFEKRIWPPVPNTETEKPMVPVKPTVKPAPPTTKPPPPREQPPSASASKPPTASKPNVCNIYAAPSVVQRKNSGGKSKSASNHDAHSGGSACSSSSTSEREADANLGVPNKGSLLVSCHNLSDALESAGLQLQAELSKSSLLQLSEQVAEVHRACSAYVDNVPATGRFRFRSLLNKLDDQAKDLRELGISGTSSQTAASNVNNIHATVKDLVAVIQR